MTMNAASNDQELNRLFCAKADASITPEEHDRLCTLLKNSREIRQQWFAFQDAETALLAWSQRETVRREEGMGIEMPGTSQAASLLAQWRYAGALAAGIVIGLVTWTLWPKPAERV